MITHDTTAIIPAAGSGSRMGFDKITEKINGTPLLALTVKTISASESISGIIIAAAPEKVNYIQKDIVEKFHLQKIIKIVTGGKTRTESVWNALRAIEIPPKIIAIHDGARPFVSVETIEKTIEMAVEFGGAIAAHKVIPTIKQVDTDNIICATIDRNQLWAAATPQAFRYDEFIAAYKKFRERKAIGENITDDAQIFEFAGKKVKIIESNPENIKLTTPFDWKVAKSFSINK